MITVTMTRTRPRYSKNIEAAAFQTVIAHAEETMYPNPLRKKGHYTNFTELMGIGRFVVLNEERGSNMFTPYDDGVSIISDMGIIIEVDSTSNGYSIPCEGEVRLVGAVGDYIYNTRHRDASYKPSFEADMLLMQNVLNDRGITLPKETVFALVLAGQIVTGDDMENWYDRERKFETPEALLAHRGLDEKTVRQINGYWDSNIRPFINNDTGEVDRH